MQHQFYTPTCWRNLLAANAEGRGQFSEFAALPKPFLDYLYNQGVPPTVAAVVNFCEADPERWQDCQEHLADALAA